MYQFKITRIVARGHDSSYSGYPFKVEVVVKMDSKLWTSIRNKKSLGALYGIDISNAVYALNQSIPASNPTVKDTERAKNGLKTIYLTYYGSSFDKAEKLGLEVKRLRSGECFMGFGTANMIYSEAV